MGRKEADRGVGVCPGQLQTGLHHSKQVGAPGWQCLLQPTVEKLEGRGITLSIPWPTCTPKNSRKREDEGQESSRYSPRSTPTLITSLPSLAVAHL